MVNTAPIANVPTPPAAGFHLDTSGPTPPPEPKMQAVLLNRNYVPRGAFEVLGWNRPEKTVKGPTGQMVVVQEAGFVVETDEETGNVFPAPPPMPGVGTPKKIWKGTVIKVPVEEAKAIRKLGIGEYELAD